MVTVLPSVLAHAGQPVAHHDRRAGCFVAGLLVVWLALESPVDALGWVGVAGVHGHRTPFEAIALLGVIALQGIWGGALFVFASRPIYEPYLDTTQPWGLDPVDDISLGGAIMCVAGLAFVLTAVVRLVSLLLSLEGGDRRRPTPTPLPT